VPRLANVAPAVRLMLSDPMSLIHNERTKLTATYLNGIAIAVFAVGSLGPSLSSLYGTVAPSWALLITSGICLIASGALHWMARQILKGLES
jgi:hypothetical protein